jgi:hypothetical protein
MTFDVGRDPAPDRRRPQRIAALALQLDFHPSVAGLVDGRFRHCQQRTGGQDQDEKPRSKTHGDASRRRFDSGDGE